VISYVNFKYGDVSITNVPANDVAVYIDGYMFCATSVFDICSVFLKITKMDLFCNFLE